MRTWSGTFVSGDHGRGSSGSARWRGVGTFGRQQPRGGSAGTTSHPAFASCRGLRALQSAVVNISTTQIVQVRSSFAFDSLFDELFDFPTAPGATRSYKTSAVGSGFVIHSSGYIVTNARRRRADCQRKVIFADKSEYEAELSRTLAVIWPSCKINAGRPLQKIELGSSDDLMVGETVIAIGNPMGLESTVTAGVISRCSIEARSSRRSWP